MQYRNDDLVYSLKVFTLSIILLSTFICMLCIIVPFFSTVHILPFLVLICNHIRFRAIKCITPYSDRYDIMMLSISIILFIFCCTALVLLPRPIAMFITFSWFIYVILVNQVLTIIFIIQLAKVICKLFLLIVSNV